MHYINRSLLEKSIMDSDFSAAYIALSSIGSMMINWILQ